MSKLKVYLAGPITGLLVDEASDWRVEIRERLKLYNIDGLSPMRGKLGVLPTDKPLSAMCGDGTKHPLTSSKGIISRDFNDVMTSDAILVNLLGAKIVSIGSMMELAWAYQARKLSIVIAEAGNIHEHAFVKETASYIVPTLDEAVNLLCCLLVDR